MLSKVLESQSDFYDFNVILNRLLLPPSPAWLHARARSRAVPLRLAVCVCAVRDTRARCGVTGKKGGGKCI